jgi:hypothetical protein
MTLGFFSRFSFTFLDGATSVEARASTVDSHTLEAPHMPKQIHSSLKTCLKLPMIIYFWMYEMKQYCNKALERTYPFFVFCIKEMLGSILTILVLCLICLTFINLHLMMTV